MLGGWASWKEKGEVHEPLLREMIEEVEKEEWIKYVIEVMGTGSRCFGLAISEITILLYIEWRNEALFI